MPDESKFAWGLPGTIEPLPDFDPLGFAEGCSLAEMKRYREAEVTHGRVSMLAVLGFLTAESFHPLFNSIGGPAIRHLDQVREVAPSFFEFLTIVIGVAEFKRASTGWMSTGMKLREDYYPGDIGFDPAGLKPTDPVEFAEMQSKELSHGRIAMLAIAGFVAQELVDGATIFKDLLETPDMAEGVSAGGGLFGL